VSTAFTMNSDRPLNQPHNVSGGFIFRERGGDAGTLDPQFRCGGENADRLRAECKKPVHES